MVHYTMKHVSESPHTPAIVSTAIFRVTYSMYMQYNPEQSAIVAAVGILDRSL